MRQFGDDIAPDLSVVIASHDAATTMPDCLTALCAQRGLVRTEVIVADSSADGTADLVRYRFPDVKILRFPGRRTIPELRGAGIAAARGRIVALLDPYCIVGESWPAEVLALHARRPEPAVGGTVDLAAGQAWGIARWAAFFSEYAAFMPPVREGRVADLAGGNVAYKRRVLGEAEELAQAGFWKTFVNARLKAEGREFWIAPSLSVGLTKPVPFREFLRSRYHHGRCFAGRRVAGCTKVEACWRALTTPFIPVLALWRAAWNVWPKGRRRLEFLMSMPLLLLLHCSWAWGEFCGYLLGPGRSCGQLFY